MESYETVTEALKGLKARGYELDFNIAFDKLLCTQHDITLNPDNFEITEVYRFEGESDPSDEDVVYAIESKERNIKGVLTSAYGMYADTASSAMLKKLTMHLS